MADLEGKLRELALNKGPRTVLHPVTGPMVDEKDVAFAREAAALGREEVLEEAAKIADYEAFTIEKFSTVHNEEHQRVFAYKKAAKAIRALKEKV